MALFKIHKTQQQQIHKRRYKHNLNNKSINLRRTVPLWETPTWYVFNTLNIKLFVPWKNECVFLLVTFTDLKDWNTYFQLASEDFWLYRIFPKRLKNSSEIYSYIGQTRETIKILIVVSVPRVPDLTLCSWIVRAECWDGQSLLGIQSHDCNSENML